MQPSFTVLRQNPQPLIIRLFCAHALRNFALRNATMKPFVTSDENVVNKYGFRVLTAGIDTRQFERNPIMYYMHNRAAYNPKGNEVIGRWEDISKKDGKLVAKPVLDTEEKFAKTIAGKVERGFLRMASVGIQIVETSSDPKHLLAGQTRPTVTKSILREISIVDEGANDNALMLYNQDGSIVNLATGELPELAELTTKPEPKTNTMKTVNLALELAADATEVEALAAITKLKTDLKAAQDKVAAHEAATKAANDKEATQLINDATAALKLEGEAKISFVKTYEALFAADHENTKAALLVATPAKATDQNRAALGTFMKSINGAPAAGSGTDPKLSFDYMQKHDAEKLAALKENEPETYQQLVADYVKGVRYNPTQN